MTGHHLIMTGIVVYNDKITNKTWLMNIILSIFGLLLLNILLVTKLEFQFVFILLIHYFLTNIYYGLLIEFFHQYSALKFWRRRKGFTTVIIFVLGNLSLLSLTIIFIYVIYLMS
jgi:hypothetical protein